MTPQIDGCGFEKWQKATIFSSSTFNDMHAERDYFIKEIFPELNSWAKRHKIQTAYIDLRCENTEEIENNGAVATSLKHIDKSRPFFLCFIGQRIGWIPNFENDIDEETRYRYPSIKKLIDNKSITEIEIEHALQLNIIFSSLDKIIILNTSIKLKKASTPMIMKKQMKN